MGQPIMIVLFFIIVLVWNKNFIWCDVSVAENLGTVIDTNSTARWAFDVYFEKGTVHPETTKTLKVDVNYEVNTK